MTAQIIPVAVFDLVVFGATGDLSFRKLMPALYWRESDQQMPEGSRIIGVARSHLDHAGLCRPGRGGLPAAMSATASTRPCSRAWPQRITYVPLDVAQSEHWADLAEVLAGGEDRPRLFYLATSPDLFGPICEGAGAAGIVTPQSRVVLEKPIGRDLASAIKHQRPGRPGVQRIAGLSDRPLSREGIGPEPSRAAVRQLAVRGGLGPGAHRPCPDHRRRDGGRRGAGGLLRQVRRLARHGAEPPAPASLPRRHGAADLDGGRFGARREAQGAALTACHVRWRGACRGPCAASTVRGPAVAWPCRATPRSWARPAEPRPSSRSRPRSRTGAGPARPSTCGPASACRRGSPRS